MGPADRAEGDAGSADGGGPAQGGGPGDVEGGAGVGSVQRGRPGVALAAGGGDAGGVDGGTVGGEAGQVGRAERNGAGAGQAEAVGPADRAEGDAGSADGGVTGQGGGPGDGDLVGGVGSAGQGCRAGDVQPDQIADRAQRNRGTGQAKVVTRPGDARHVGTARRGEVQIAQQGDVAHEGEIAGRCHIAREARAGRAGGESQPVDGDVSEPEGTYAGNKDVLGIGPVADIDRAVTEREIDRALEVAAGDGDRIVTAGHVRR